MYPFTRLKYGKGDLDKARTGMEALSKGKQNRGMIKVIYNGRVYQKRGSFCEALIIDKGRIAGTGSSRELLEAVPPGAEKIDAQGALVMPAFYDSHVHLMWLGRRAGGIEGAGAESIEEIIRRGRDFMVRLKPPPHSFIQGAGINPDLFSSGEKRDLCREDLDKISVECPIILSRHCGHTIYCNSLALKLAGISERGPELEGGTIEKDENGRPTGILRENANALVRKLIPAPSREEMKRLLSLAMNKAHSLGISACGSYDAGGPDFESIVEVFRDIYDESRETGIPALRVTMQCGISSDENYLDYYLNRIKTSGRLLWEDPRWGTFLKMGPLKLFADGTLGGQTAWMKQPYWDKPETRGFPVLDENTLNRFVQKAAAGTMQTVIHAIGDAGMDAVISAYEKITAPGENHLRHGIIHCQISSTKLLERMARNKILALVQPIFLADDIHILESRVGPELASTSYAWGTMEKLGIPVSYSTDAPVASLDPLPGLEWAVLRRSSDGITSPGCLNPRERVDLYSAVDAYTAGSAFACFDENSLGRIAPGYMADLIFIDRDIFTTPPDEIRRARLLQTMCAGEIVYRA